MKLSNVLARIQSSEKTASQADGASEKTASAASPTEDKLKAALKEAMAPAAIPTEKKAEAGSPVESLTKIAGDLANQEHAALVKEAQFYGAAVADGFMARLSQYNEAAEKIAGQQPIVPATPGKIAGDESFEKFAQENPALVKEAAELGYGRTMDQMTKLAEAAYAKGNEEATLAIYKLAHQTFVQGFEDTARLLQEIR